MTGFHEVASGLRFPEGPIALGDGAVRCCTGPRRGWVGSASGGSSNRDSLAVDADGNVCVATLGPGGITVISPGGALIEFIGCDDVLTTNIAFGGAGLRTAFVTLSSTGRLVSFDYPRGGLPLEFLDR